MSKLAQQIIAKEKQEKTGLLNLRKCGLTEVPNEVGKLVWLEELILSNSYFGRRQLTELESLSNLPYLKKLNLGQNQIIDIRPLEKFTGLQYLNIKRNQITDIRPLEMSALNYWKPTVSVYCKSV